MTVNQIYSVVNNIAENMTTGTAKVVDYTTFVSFGNDVISSTTNKSIFMEKLVDRIGRTIFAIRDYDADKRFTLVDEFTFGNILQKISYKLQDAESNSSWSTTPSNPYEWEAKDGVEQKLFAQAMPTFCFTDVIYSKQIESAFISAEAMSGFINGLYTRMYNALAVDVEGMVNATVNGLVDKIHSEVTATQPINVKRCRNLLKEYNTTHTPITSETTALETPEFLMFACVEMGIMPDYLKKMSKEFNDGSVERFTTADNLVVEMSTQFDKLYSVYLKSNTFHDSLVALPNYSTVPYWLTPNEPMSIYDKLGNVALPNVICIMRDKDACACTLQREKFASMYDDINERTYVKLSADRRYVADTSENAVVFYLKYEEESQG